MEDISNKLQNGWNPNKKQSNYKNLVELIDLYIKILEERYGVKDIRFDTLRTYKSLPFLFKDYVKSKSETLEINNFTQSYCLKYLHYLKITKNLSYRYVNNLRAFLKTFSNFLIDYGYLETNPVLKIKSYKNREKIRQIIPEIILKNIFNI